LKVSHTSSIRLIALSTSLLLGLSGVVHAADPSPSYPDLLLDDIQHVLTGPSRWQSEEWKSFGCATLAVAGTAIFIDGPLRDGMRRQPRDNSFMLNIERFGAEYSIAVVGGFYLAGSLADNDKAITVAQDGLTASIIASGLITPAIKIVTGRSRPYEDAGSNNFQALGADKRSSSFPSGHTTEAFALASVISANYEETWIKSSVYTVAALVGVARTYHDVHFASDVLAGALIGNWVGQSVVSHNQTRRTAKVILLPELAPDLFGLRLTGIF
jgi:membrane-associated phospholipid phosphatase